MGPSCPPQDDVKLLLREKDDRIETLEARLEAYTARASTDQARLLKTIDVLDALRSQHALEISSEENVKMRLMHQVDRWRAMANNLEVEKDELKDVVEDLIDKGMLNFSNIHMNSTFKPRTSGAHGHVAECTSRNTQRGNLNVDFPEQVVACSIDHGRSKDADNADALVYATSIIARLKTELDFERQAHCRTVEEANLRIEELEAKVAVREAELEKCITSSVDGDHQRTQPETTNVSGLASEKRRLDEKLPKPKPLSDEECLQFLESNNVRNRSLELEIRQISEKLERARATSPSNGFVQSATPHNSRRTIATPSPRARSASFDPSTLSRRSGPGKAPFTPATKSPSTVLSIAQLDNQIREISAHMDALVSERAILIDVAAKRRRITEGVDVDPFSEILRVEGECVRLQSEVDDLREQLQHARFFARGREKALLREIAQLRASSSTSSGQRLIRDHPIGPRPLEDEIVAEESMELASPLIPAIVPDISFPLSPSHASSGIEADLVAFPFSPKHESSPPPQSPSMPHRTVARRSPGTQEMDRVRTELDTAHAHLAQKEEVLVQPRTELERLQVGTQGQSDGE